MRNLPRIATLVVVVLFTLVLVDYLVIRQIGVRMLPLGYVALRRAFYLLGMLTAAIAFWTFRRPRRERTGFFRTEVAWHRLIVLFSAPVVVVTLVGFFGRFFWLADLFAHFRAQYAVLLVSSALGLVTLKERRWASLVGGFAIVNLLVIAPQYFPWPSASARSGTVVRFVLANVNVKNEDSATLMRFLDEVDGDVVLLEEVSARWLVDVSSLDEAYPHSVKAPLPSPFGIALWSRLPLRSTDVVHYVHEKIPTIVATLDVGGEEILFVGTHPMRPRDGATSPWRDEQLLAIADLARDAKSHVVVLGDLNTTPWGHGFRSFVERSGLVDSSLGMGPQWSWPSEFWPLGIPIDHALVSGSLRVVDRFIGRSIGSDHYPLVVDVSF